MPSSKRRGWRPAYPWPTARFVGTTTIVALVVSAGTFQPALVSVGVALAIALLGFVAADLSIGPRRGELEIRRLPLDHLALRTAAVFRYEVVNRGASTVRFGLIDTPIDNIQMPEAAVTGCVGPRRRVVAELPVEPRERGAEFLGDLYVWAENAIGLVRRRWVVESDVEARVFPDLSAVERYGMLARRGRLVEAGYRKLRLRGGAGEFDSLREYGPNDEFRSINWKATARRGKLMATQYDVERSQTVMLVLDAGRLMTPRIGAQRKFDYAVTAALSVASIAGLADDKVGLLAFAGDVLEHISPRSGSRHASSLTQAIYDLQPRFEEADYAAAFAYLRRRQPKRSLVIFFTDMFDPVASAIVLANVAVLSPRHLVMCVLMNDEAIESALAVVPASAMDAFRASVAASLLAERRRASAILAQRGIGVIDVPAARLTTALINAYVEVKARDLI